MPTCSVCLKELPVEEPSEATTVSGAHHCQAANLDGEPGAGPPDSDSPAPTSQIHQSATVGRPASFELEQQEKKLPGRSLSSRPRLPALDIIRRGTIRRSQTIARTVERLGIFDQSSTANSHLLPSGKHKRHCPRTLPASSDNRPSLPAIPEGESEPGSELPGSQPSTRSPPIPPLTPWRRLLLIQDYADRDEELSTIINRLDDAIASSPELWTSGSSEGIDGQLVSPLQFYRRLHEFHQQRFAHCAPGSVPYFFPRLGAKQYEW